MRCNHIISACCSSSSSSSGSSSSSRRRRGRRNTGISNSRNNVSSSISSSDSSSSSSSGDICTKSNISFILVVSILVCLIQQGSAFAYMPSTGIGSVSIYRKFSSVYSLRAVSSTEKPARSYQVETMGPGSPSFANLSNLKQAKGISSNSQLPELEKLSESDLLKGTPMDAGERNAKALSLAYDRCEHVTKLFSKTFYMGTSLMRPDARKHVWAIYAWCRRTDDIVDSPRALLNKDVLQDDLDVWGNRLDDIWNNHPVDLFDLAMADTVCKYPGMDPQPYRDMIAGMVMDVPGLGQERYQNFEELYLYCYRVAGTVGLMTLPVLGTAEGVSQEDATPSALALGIGLQLTNILRDVGEDLERGRIYLPLDEIKRFGLTEEDLFKCEVTPKYVEFMKFQIQRARDYYKIAMDGIPMLAPDARFAVRASLDLYSRILDVIERNGYDNFNKRAYTTKLEKLSILPGSWQAAQAAK